MAARISLDSVSDIKGEALRRYQGLHRDHVYEVLSWVRLNFSMILTEIAV